MIFRTLKIEEIERELFADFIRHQVVEDCWRKENDTWVVKSDDSLYGGRGYQRSRQS